MLGEQPRTRANVASGLHHLWPLDGLRAVAACGVVVFHAFAIPRGKLQLVTFYGWTGVDLFFVLSGYLITTILLDNREALNFYSAFYARRALRIFPVYYLAIFLCFVVMPGVARRTIHFEQHFFVHTPWDVQIFFWLNLSNWKTAYNYLLVPPLTHFWTLAIEEQFYLVWPLAVRNLSNRALAWVCGLAMVVECLLRNLPAIQRFNLTHENFIYRMTFLHTDGLFAGALLALLLRSRYRHQLQPAFRFTLGAGLLILALMPQPFLAESPGATRVGYTVLALMFAGLIGLVVTDGPGWWPNRILSTKPFTSLGRVSFAFYVVHYPLLRILMMAGARWNALAPLRLHMQRYFFLLVVVTIALSYLIALASWYALESPILRLKRHFKYRFA